MVTNFCAFTLSISVVFLKFLTYFILWRIFVPSILMIFKTLPKFSNMSPFLPIYLHVLFFFIFRKPASPVSTAYILLAVQFSNGAGLTCRKQATRLRKTTSLFQTLPVKNSSSGQGGTLCAHPPLWKFIWLEHARSWVSCHNYHEVTCETAQLCPQHCFLVLILCQWVLQSFCPFFQAVIRESWEKQMRHRYPT